MRSTRDARGARLAAPLVVSIIAHGLLLGAVVAFRPPPPKARPPIYHVDLVAAPPGPRAAGIVTPTPAPTTPPPKPAPPPPRPQTPPHAMPMPNTKPPARSKPAATPMPPAPKPPVTPTPPQPAGGGPTGGRGTDVATVHTEGVEFPFPGYLENIVRQIAVRFGQHRNTTARAEVQFVIRRDGSVTGFNFVQRSGDFSFDLDAQGAVEAAGKADAFGPLPDGFPDDALTVIFSFDPRVVH